jgi:hypothetical protein
LFVILVLVFFFVFLSCLFLFSSLQGVASGATAVINVPRTNPDTVVVVVLQTDGVVSSVIGEDLNPKRQGGVATFNRIGFDSATRSWSFWVRLDVPINTVIVTRNVSSNFSYFFIEYHVLRSLNRWTTITGAVPDSGIISTGTTFFNTSCQVEVIVTQLALFNCRGPGDSIVPPVENPFGGQVYTDLRASTVGNIWLGDSKVSCWLFAVY